MGTSTMTMTLVQKIGQLPRLAGRISRARLEVAESILFCRRISVGEREHVARCSKFHVSLVQSADDPGFDTLLVLAGQQGLDREWCSEQLALGACECVVKVAGSGEPAAIGMVIARPFYVAELDYTFDPMHGGCYFYCEYVHPSFRGQRLKGLLDAARAAHAASRGAAIAYSIVAGTNFPSIRAHVSGHFRAVVKVIELHWSRWRFYVLRRTNTRFPSGRFVRENASNPGGPHLLRRCNFFARPIH